MKQEKITEIVMGFFRVVKLSVGYYHNRHMTSPLSKPKELYIAQRVNLQVCQLK